MSSDQDKLTMTETDLGKAYQIAFVGDIDLYTLDRAKARIATLIDKGKIQLVFILDKVKYIDSSGLGLFIGSLKRVKERGGDIRLVNLNAYMMGIFKLINLHKVMDIHSTVDEALKAFAKTPSAAG